MFRPSSPRAAGDAYGIGALSVLDAARLDGVTLPWMVDGPGAAELIRLMESCLAVDPHQRPLLGDVHARLRTLEQAERARMDLALL